MVAVGCGRSATNKRLPTTTNSAATCKVHRGTLFCALLSFVVEACGLLCLFSLLFVYFVVVLWQPPLILYPPLCCDCTRTNVLLCQTVIRENCHVSQRRISPRWQAEASKATWRAAVFARAVRRIFLLQRNWRCNNTWRIQNTWRSGAHAPQRAWSTAGGRPSF